MKIPTPSGQSNSISGLTAGNLAANSIDRTASESVDMLVNQGDGVLGQIMRGPGPGKGFSYFLLVPSLIAFGISCYLAFAALTASDVAGCGGGSWFDCSHVLHSKYSKWLGVPVSIFAAVNYLFMLIALATISMTNAGAIVKKISWAAVSCLGIAAGLAAIWFTYVQAAVLGHFCPWCLGAHCCGIVIATAIAFKRPVGTGLTIATAVLAGASIVTMGLMQWMAEEPAKFTITVYEEESDEQSQSDQDPGTDDGLLFSAPMDEDGSVFEAPGDEEEAEETEDTSNDTSARIRQSPGLFASSLMALMSNTSMVTYTPQEEGTQAQEEGSADAEAAQEEEKPKRRTVRIKGNLQLDPKQWPLLGKPDAKHIFVEMFDYACPHCRATHRTIKGAFDQMGEDVAVIVLPVPLNSACNNAVTRTGAKFVDSCRMAKLAVACWRVDPEQFEVFHHWMFESASCPSYDRAKQKVDELVGKEKVDEELGKEAVNKYVNKHVELYKHVGRGIVPKLLFPTSAVEGEYSNTNGLVRMIRDRAK